MSEDSQSIKIAIQIAKEKAEPTKNRLNAILFIINQYKPKLLSVFEEMLTDASEDPDVRSASALALGKIGGDRALELLLNYANSDDLTVKNYSLQALGMIGREEAVPILLDALKHQNNDVFASAAEALGQIGKPVVPHLIRLLDQGADDARCVAAWQLGSLRYPDAIPALIKVIHENDNPEVQALSIWALGEIGFGNEPVIDVLQWAKKQEDPALHQRANMALKKIARHVN